MDATTKETRIGRLPVVLPTGVKAEMKGRTITVSGKLGQLTMDVHDSIEVEVGSEIVQVRAKDAHRKTRALHGLTRVLVNNMVTGVSKGYEKQLTLIGVGYRASLKGKDLQLEVGKSHDVIIPVPEGISTEVSKKQDQIIVKGIDKAKVGQFAAEIIAQRPPEPYKGKGIRYTGQHIKLKAGKKAGKK
jgi:large subunit ribosomal protein L6